MPPHTHIGAVATNQKHPNMQPALSSSQWLTFHKTRATQKGPARNDVVTLFQAQRAHTSGASLRIKKTSMQPTVPRTVACRPFLSTRELQKNPEAIS